MDSKRLESYQRYFLPNLFRRKVALVTGGGSGIGFTIADILMRHGCQVVIASRNLDRLTVAAHELSEASPLRQCLPIKMDVRKIEEVRECVDHVLKQFGRLDYLINGAAGNFLCPASALSQNGFRTVMDIDALGTFTASQVVYEKYMKDHGGVIVNISATLHLNGMVMQAHAGAAKAAVDALTKHLAVEWGPDNVRVVGVAPGPIQDTPGFDKLMGSQLKRIERHIPLRKAGEKVDIANVVTFLLSDAARLMTGETVIADGGQWLGTPNSMALVQEFTEGGGDGELKSKL